MDTGNIENEEGQLKLWYSEAAKEWVEALPIGNGRLGGMVFGGIEKELIQLNEDTLWSGMPKSSENVDAVNYLLKVRSLIFDEKVVQAQKLLEEKMLGRWTQAYLPLADLTINFDINGVPKNYSRELNIEKAVARTEFEMDGGRYSREVFASFPDRIIVIKFSCSQRKKISFSAFLESQLESSCSSLNDDCIELTGRCPVNIQSYSEGNNIEYDLSGKGMKFNVAAKLFTEGGTGKSEGGKLEVSNADSAVVIISAATGFNGFDKDPEAEGKDCKADSYSVLKNISGFSYMELYQRHIEDYSNLYKRVDINLCAEKNSSLTTDKRIEAVKNGAGDPHLAALYFQYARYLMISCSRAGTQPATLQGIWNKDIIPAWNCNYTTNINTEMNYWLPEAANLAECHEPLFDMLEEMAQTGAKTAKLQYGCSGWTVNHNTDIWRHSDPVAGKAMWAYWPMGGPWMCRHLWEHYEFGKNKKFLMEKAYPLMSGAAEFCLDWLIEDKDGRLVTCPSTSPENAYRTPYGEQCSVSMASTMDMSIIRDLFSNCIKAARILDEDNEFTLKLENALKKLYPLQIGKHGQLMEWYKDFEDIELGHRHLSHLFGLYPGSGITKENSPEFFEACRKSLEIRLQNGGGHTGWSCAWIINLFARLGDADSAKKYVNILLGRSSYPNLFDAHPPFQIDGNFGGAAGIAEMLLQSHTGEICLLPALPDTWSEGHVKGLRARGGLEVDMEWEKGELVTASIKASQQGQYKICYRDINAVIQLSKGENCILDRNLIIIIG